ncbi:glycosyltransferase family A protein [Leptothoe sp. EHU-05/26/07-4]
MSFAFILPVIHPDSVKVSNYEHVEIVLKRTLESLRRQTFTDIKIIVVCCKIPDWAKDIGDNIYFLDVADSKTFKPNRNIARVDMGLKFIVGILYALEKFKVDLFMRVDGDDYVNSNLAKYAINSLDKTLQSSTVDGYIINKGLQIEVKVNSNNEIEYGNTYFIRRFNSSCGTCRIFKQATLRAKLLEIHSDIFSKSSHWLAAHQERTVAIPTEMTDWLDQISKDHYAEEWHPVNILGRHINQSEYLNFENFPFLGAAKACGHGNHDGPREGKIHQDKMIGKLPKSILESTFGIKDVPEAFRMVLNFYMSTIFHLQSKLN